MLFRIIFFIGRYSKKVRLFYHKVIGDYPWGVMQFIKDCDKLDVNCRKDGHLTKDEFNGFLREIRDNTK